MSGRIWLLAGPPFGPALFRGAVARVQAAWPGLEVEARSVVALGETPRGAAEALAKEVSADDVVFAHGLAVPVAIELGHLVPVGRLVLSNGPLTTLDPVTAAVSRLAAAPGAVQVAFHPWPWLLWLRSSVGLRRAVNNPYAMDRDTVAALAAPLVSDRAARRKLGVWLRALGTGWADAGSLPGAVTLFWGDNDRLHPLAEADSLTTSRPSTAVTLAPGGRFAWPEELPWLLADTLAAWASSPTTTPESHKAVPPAPQPSQGAVKVELDG